jgi:hypothetical protein
MPAYNTNQHNRANLIKQCIVVVVLVLIPKYYFDSDQAQEVQQLQNWLEENNLQQFSKTFLKNGMYYVLEGSPYWISEIKEKLGKSAEVPGKSKRNKKNLLQLLST